MDVGAGARAWREKQGPDCKDEGALSTRGQGEGLSPKL